MAVGIDSIAPGRFGVDIMPGWQRAEHAQAGLRPGAGHDRRRCRCCAECVTTMKEPWAAGRSDFKSDLFASFGVKRPAGVAAVLDEAAAVQEVALTFDGSVVGMEPFGQRIQPLTARRQHLASLRGTAVKHAGVLPAAEVRAALLRTQGERTEPPVPWAVLPSERHPAERASAQQGQGGAASCGHRRGRWPTGLRRIPGRARTITDAV